MEPLCFVIDIDDTLSVTPKNENGTYNYAESKPIPKVVAKVRELFLQGHKVILFTSRGMRTFKGDGNAADDHHRMNLHLWLEKNNVPYHALYFGKPWSGTTFYVDDKALTIDQFLRHEADEYSAISAANQVNKF